MGRTEKFTLKMISEVAKMVSTGATLDEASKVLNFSYTAFLQTLSREPEKKQIYDAAKLQNLEALVKVADEGTKKLLNGFTDEKTIKKYKIVEKDGVPTKRLVSETIEKVIFPPNSSMIQYMYNREERLKAKLNPTETTETQPIIFNETKIYETSEAKDETTTEKNDTQR